MVVLALQDVVRSTRRLALVAPFILAAASGCTAPDAGGLSGIYESSGGDGGGVSEGDSGTSSRAAPTTSQPTTSPTTAPTSTTPPTTTTPPTSTTPAGWTLSWSDEFEGTAIDTSKWGFDTGGGGWGNGELENYTNRPQNAAVSGGMLKINAIKEDFGGSQYTSARLLTKGKFDQKFGRYEARIKIPVGTGVWPAFWMLGSNIAQASWPACGEIDIMENIGKPSETALSYGTLHGPQDNGGDYYGGAGLGSSFKLPSGRLTDDFHIYSVEWSEDQITFFVDGKQTADKTTGAPKTMRKSDLPSGWQWAFGDHSFFIILNVAVGGQWPGNPDGSTALPQTMSVDYVRVYTKSG